MEPKQSFIGGAEAEERSAIVYEQILFLEYLRHGRFDA